MNKKFFATISTILILSLMFVTGCGDKSVKTDSSDTSGQAQKSEQTTVSNESKASTPSNIKFFLWGTKDGISSAQKIADRFNTSQNEVKVEVSGVEASVYFQKLNAYFASNTAPDVIQVAADYGDAYTAKNVFEPLDEYLNNASLSGKWPQSLLDALKYKDKVYALPVGTQVPLMVYNKKLFDEAGVSYPQKGWTEQEFLDAAKKLTVPEKKQWGVLLQGWPKMMSRDLYGQYCYDWDKKAMTAEGNQGFRDSLQFLITDLLHTYKVGPAATNTKDIGGGFETGKYGMALAAVWDLVPFSKTIANKFEWDVAPLPTNEKYGKWKAPLFIQAFAISSASKNKEAAFKFMTWWSTDKAPQTSMSDSFPVCNDVLNDQSFLTSYTNGETPYDKTLVIDTISNGIPFWNTGVIAEINNTVIDPELEKLMLKPNDTSIDKAITNIQKNGQKLFDKNK